MTSHPLPNGINVASFNDYAEWDEIAFGLRQRKIVLGADGDSTGRSSC